MIQEARWKHLVLIYKKKRLKRLTMCLKSVTESDLIKIRKGFEVLYYVA